ncbi:hypothetical protein LDENG_00132000 [Lucifuga dentata]|nr:hypothetical protein LDENG_00132000 [Lucifuga dentata]
MYQRKTTRHTKGLKGGSQKTTKRQSTKRPAEKITSDIILPSHTEESHAPPSILRQCTDNVLPCTPKRTSRRTRLIHEACLTSTPVHSPSSGNPSNMSESPPGSNEVHQEHFKHKKAEPRFELKEPDSTEQDRVNPDEPLLSSDLSVELTDHEEQLPSFSFQEDEEEDEDDEELPSFLMKADKKPPSITEGAFVLSKVRNYPYWPAVVKSVNRKLKKASIVFIDDPMIYTKKKGITVALKNLKAFDCEEAKELVCKAKENYDAAIEWSLELITDYRIRIACGSFSGSFIEYFAHNMSYPVRRKYPQAASERLSIASDTFTEEQDDDNTEESFSEQQEGVRRCSKRFLPDRTHAAHNRANEKLVYYIVKQRMVEEHLLTVISGQQQSKWLSSFMTANRTQVVNVYLEDDKQLDQVYWYLNGLCATALTTVPCVAELKSMERVPFVLDVLLPEAIICAIAGVENVSREKAEEKYLKGRRISNRERQEFDLMIEEQMKTSTASENDILTFDT